jgi:diguanylate cyclase (GGDEF)-like protein
VAIISVRLGHIRERLRDQAAELKLALARNQELATRDVLTGLTNRRAMLEQMAIAAREIERHGQPLALVLFDLDHFKQINDTRGHAAGDRVLQRFGEVAQAEIRAGDVLARWGGEEFLLLLPRTGLEEAWRCAERIRTRLVALSWMGAAGATADLLGRGVLLPPHGSARRRHRGGRPRDVPGQGHRPQPHRAGGRPGPGRASQEAAAVRPDPGAPGARPDGGRLLAWAGAAPAGPRRSTCASSCAGARSRGRGTAGHGDRAQRWQPGGPARPGQVWRTALPRKTIWRRAGACRC